MGAQLSHYKLVTINMKLLCGLAAIALGSEEKIIGGSVVSPNSEPYILSLQRSGSHFCGGTVTSAGWGISAAHCYYAANSVTAVGGAHTILKATSRASRRRCCRASPSIRHTTRSR